jgi:hypothetical protein
VHSSETNGRLVKSGKNHPIFWTRSNYSLHRQSPAAMLAECQTGSFLKSLTITPWMKIAQVPWLDPGLEHATFLAWVRSLAPSLSPSGSSQPSLLVTEQASNSSWASPPFLVTEQSLNTIKVSWTSLSLLVTEQILIAIKDCSVTTRESWTSPPLLVTEQSLSAAVNQPFSPGNRTIVERNPCIWSESGFSPVTGQPANSIGVIVNREME